MKNNFITKIIGATLAFAMMIGGAVGINAAKQAKEVNAAAASVEAGYQWATMTAGTNGSTAVVNYNSGTTSHSAIKVGTSSKGGDMTIAVPAGAVSLKLYAYAWNGVTGLSLNITATSGSTDATISPTSIPLTANSGIASSSPFTFNGTPELTEITLSGVDEATVLKFATSSGKRFVAWDAQVSTGSAATCSVTYSAEDATDGTVPTDDTEYESGDTVTVLGNPNGLAKANYIFAGWEADGVKYEEGDTFTISGDTTLTIVWEYYRHYVDDTSANTITWDLANPEFVAASETQISWESPKATMVADKASATTATNNYCPPDKTSTRLYQNSSLAITPASGYQINSVVFTATTNDYASALKNSSWTNASATSVTTTVTVIPAEKKTAFSATIGATTGFTSVVVHYGVATYEPALQLDKYTVSMKTNNTDGVDVTATVDNVASPTYSWTTDDTNITLVNSTSRTVTIKPNTETAGSASVHLTIGGTEANLEADVEVTLTDPLPGETAGTAYTVQQAKDSIDDEGDQNNVYVRGIISQIDTYHSSYHSITYWISDNGTTTNQFEVYSGKGLNGANFSSISDLVLGSTVVVYGNIQLYNSVYEFGANSRIHSLQLPPQVNSITLTPSEITVEPNEAGDIIDLFTNIVIDQDSGSTKSINDIEWSSDDDSVFYIDGGEYLVAGAHRTSTTIHASINGTEYATATINVLDQNVHTMTYDSPEWRAVTDPSTLTAGDQVILTGVKNDTVFAAGTYESGNNLQTDEEHALTVSNGVATGVLNTMIYTLEAGSVDGSFAFKDSSGKYLFAAASGNNYMRTQDDIDGNASFILNANGTVIAQGTNTRNYMRFNPNGEGHSLFSCYASTSTVGSVVKFYKLSVGTAELDLFNLNSISEAHEDENGAYIRLGVSLSENDWNAIDSAFGIAGYGVMLIRETTLEATTFDTIAELYNSNDSENKAKLSNRGKDSDTAPQDFSVAAKINVRNDSDRNVVFCAAVYVKSSSGAIYFINETRGSLVGLL